MIDLSNVTDLPVDELGLAILEDLLATLGRPNERHDLNEYNYTNELAQNYGADSDTQKAVAEGFAWLKMRGYLGVPPSNHTFGAVFVTRAARRAAEGGISTVRMDDRVQVGMHESIERTVRRQFMLGELELGVIAAFREVEIRVRALGRFQNELVGVSLMTEAFRPSDGNKPQGPLADPASPSAEQEGMMALFRGAYAVLRNPASHRDVDYNDPMEAVEAVATASLLMRILDGVERRLPGLTNP